MGILSSTKSSSTTNNTDIAIQRDTGLQDSDNAQIVSGDKNVISYSDSGAIQAAVDMSSNSQAFLGQTFASALGMVQQQNASTVEQVATAYKTSSGAIDGEKVLIGVTVAGVLMFVLSKFKGA